MDKFDKLLDAMEHPDLLPESELEALLQDPEIKEVLELLDKTKTSLHPMSDPDVEAEWKAFETKQKSNGFRKFNPFSRNVAAGIAIAIASLAAMAAVVGVGINYKGRHNDMPKKIETVVAEEIRVKTDSVDMKKEIIVSEPNIIIFENEPFESIISQISDYYGYEADFINNDSKSLRLFFRWNQALTIEEVAESLNNFEQIHLSIKDKTIAID